MPSLHTNASTDHELIAVWLRSHADVSPHTRRAYERIGRRFVDALAATGANLRRHTIDDVHAALEAMRTRADGTPASGATANMSVAAVKALLGFAHKVGFSRFNAAPLIKLRKVQRQRAQRLLSEVDAHLLMRAAKSGRDRLLLQVAYYGALRVSELASLTWGQVLPRETGEAQLAIVGKGDKPRNVLLPAELATALASMRGDAPGDARVFPTGSVCGRRRSSSASASSRPCSKRRSPIASTLPSTSRSRRRSSSSRPAPWASRGSTRLTGPATARAGSRSSA